MGKDGQWNIEHTVIEQHRDGGVAEGATAVADRAMKWKISCQYRRPRSPSSRGQRMVVILLGWEDVRAECQGCRS